MEEKVLLVLEVYRKSTVKGLEGLLVFHITGADIYN